MITRLSPQFRERVSVRYVELPRLKTTGLHVTQRGLVCQEKLKIVRAHHLLVTNRNNHLSPSVPNTSGWMATVPCIGATFVIQILTWNIKFKHNEIQ